MKWRKLGRVYVAHSKQGWARGWAMLPTTLLLDGGDRIRVFVSSLDEQRVGRVGYVDVDGRDPRRVLSVSERPVLDIGPPGAFDDNGVNPVSICEADGTLRLYYVGWQLGVRVRYFLFMGLATSNDCGESFLRHSHAPVFERSDEEYLVRAGGHIRPFSRGWRAWYAGGRELTHRGGKQQPTYQLRYLESPDGLSWGPSGEVCLQFSGSDEFGFGRPSVVPHEGVLRMWYSIRTHSKGYRIGYAESEDGRKWERRDDRAGIDVSDAGWDSEMVCFPCIEQTPYGTYMFYNGNGYGESGFGVAIEENG